MAFLRARSIALICKVARFLLLVMWVIITGLLMPSTGTLRNVLVIYSCRHGKNICICMDSGCSSVGRAVVSILYFFLKFPPRRGIEPWPPAWQARILTTILSREKVLAWASLQCNFDRGGGGLNKSNGLGIRQVTHVEVDNLKFPGTLEVTLTTTTTTTMRRFLLEKQNFLLREAFQDGLRRQRLLRLMLQTNSVFRISKQNCG